MKEFIPGICWQEFPTSNQLAVNALNNAGFKALRIFFNLCDLPYIATPNQAYIKNLFATMPNGEHAWTFEGHASVNTTTEPMRASFNFCKKYSWLPIVCMGYQEELPHNWLGRAPLQQYWGWLGKFAKEFAIYLKSIYGFNRADLEVYNEPSKLQALGFGYDKYCSLAYIMAIGWKSVTNYKVHVFVDDLLRQDYLMAILNDTALMQKVDYISTHCGLAHEDQEWDRGLIIITNQKIAKYPHLKQALTEMSVNGTWSRLQNLHNLVAMYCIIGAIRNIEFGTSTRIDDIFMWDRAGNLQCSSPTKRDIITAFNKTYYKPYTIVEDDMELELNYVKLNTVNNETKIVQEILVDSGYLTLVTGKCDAATVAGIKKFQADKKITVDGWVGKGTWEKLLLETPTGYTRFLPLFMQLLTKTAVYR